ncbi:hypothetical protein GQ53DRAFT_798970 [Thozetella sp. PMI_491]|nr:hypothetical protein GQ53DRAFT_798970 [Thozetella sp. PMI_491]
MPEIRNGAKVLLLPSSNEHTLLISAANTLNDTAPGVVPFVAAAAASVLKIGLHNNLGGAQLNAYVTAHDPNGAVVMLKTDGTWYRPNPNGSKVPVAIPDNSGTRLALGAQGSTIDITIPTFLTAGRVYIAQGNLQFYTLLDGGGVVQLVEPSFANSQDPNRNVNWGFVELTVGSAIFANISFVDFIGLLLGMSVTYADGSVQKVPGLKPGSMSTICKGLTSQAAIDGQPWDKMCVTDSAGNPLRILSPNIYTDINRDAMLTYYSSYIDQVWSKYTNQDLIIKSASHGDVHCRVSGAKLVCPGDSTSFAKPSIRDIWGCNSGPFARVDGNDVHEDLRPRVCAAFHRTTLLLAGGDVQPSLSAANYYLSSPTNHYARLVHQNEVDNRGYAFSFDDVNPVAGVDQSGTLAGSNYQRLDIFVGGM